MAGVRNGCERSPLRRSISRCGTRYHRKFNFQLNPPHVLQSNGQSERSQRGPPAEAVANEGKRRGEANFDATYMSEAVTYSNVSSEMTSMMGQTTALRLLTISARRGSSHPSVHSQCASRKVSTLPLACLAPNSLERIEHQNEDSQNLPYTTIRDRFPHFRSVMKAGISYLLRVRVVSRIAAVVQLF